jgi:hypothetical protein
MTVWPCGIGLQIAITLTWAGTKEALRTKIPPQGVGDASTIRFEHS